MTAGGTGEGSAEGGAASSAVRHTTSLLFNVSTLLQEPIGSVRRYEVTNARGNGLSSDVSGALRLLRTDHSILATAELSTVVAELCGGCLCEITLPMALAFDEEFWPPAEAASDDYLQPPQEQDWVFCNRRTDGFVGGRATIHRDGASDEPALRTGVSRP